MRRAGPPTPPRAGPRAGALSRKVGRRGLPKRRAPGSPRRAGPARVRRSGGGGFAATRFAERERCGGEIAGDLDCAVDLNPAPNPEVLRGALLRRTQFGGRSGSSPATRAPRRPADRCRPGRFGGPARPNAARGRLGSRPDRRRASETCAQAALRRDRPAVDAHLTAGNQVAEGNTLSVLHGAPFRLPVCRLFYRVGIRG